MSPFRSWQDEAMRWFGSESRPHAVIGDRWFDISRVYLDKGKCMIDIMLPPCAEEVRGHVRLYGEDGELVSEGKTYIIPPHSSTVSFAYGLVVYVDTWDQETNLGELPGWR